MRTVSMVVVLVAMALASNAEEEPKDYESFSPAVLVILADNMVIKLNELEAKLQLMQQHAEGESEADGDDKPGDESKPAEEEKPYSPGEKAASNGAARANPLLDKPKSPHAGLDKPALVARCLELESLIKAKQGEIAQASGTIGAQFGGEITTVGDDSVYIEQGEWVVTVIENREPDPTPLKEKIAGYDKELSDVRPQLEREVQEAQRELSAADSALAGAESHFDKMHEKRTVYRRLPSGNRVQDTEYIWSETHRKPASKRKREATKRQKAADKVFKTAERKLNAAVKKHGIQVGRLEREIEAMMRARELVVEIDNDGGQAVVLATQAYLELASTMQPESRFTIRGRGRFTPADDEPGRITLKEAEPAE